MTPASNIRSENPVFYGVAKKNEANQDAIIEEALAILQSRFKPGESMNTPSAVRAYLTLTQPDDMREHFRVLWLDAQHRVIELEEVSAGTLTQATVYMREVVKSGLSKHAAACIVTHNHPSGNTEPSEADKTLTRHLKTACAYVDIRVLDHIITAGGRSMSFAEQNLI